MKGSPARRLPKPAAQLAATGTRGSACRDTPVRFVPVRMAEASSAAVEPERAVNARAAAEMIEVVLPDGSRLRVGNEVGLAMLRRVLMALRG